MSVLFPKNTKNAPIFTIKIEYQTASFDVVWFDVVGVGPLPLKKNVLFQMDLIVQPRLTNRHRKIVVLEFELLAYFVSKFFQTVWYCFSHILESVESLGTNEKSIA
jgi:hypothetical protein